MIARTLATAALLLLAACQPIPAHADVLLDKLPPDPGRPGRQPPAQRRAPTDRPADLPGVDVPSDGALAPDPTRGGWGWGSWGQNPEEIPLPVVPPVTPCRPTSDVPGPLGIAGAAAAYGWSRRIRSRITTTTP